MEDISESPYIAKTRCTTAFFYSTGIWLDRIWIKPSVSKDTAKIDYFWYYIKEKCRECGDYVKVFFPHPYMSVKRSKMSGWSAKFNIKMKIQIPLANSDYYYSCRQYCKHKLKVARIENEFLLPKSSHHTLISTLNYCCHFKFVSLVNHNLQKSYTWGVYIVHKMMIWYVLIINNFGRQRC